MDRVLDSKKISPHTLAGVGVAVHATGTHIGLLYRDNDNEPVVLLHLGWHNSLRREAISPAYLCWVRPAIHPDRADAVAAFCRRIWKQNSHGRVPYGLSKPGRFFDRSGAPFKALKGPADVGLTCATFVLEVFDQAGIPLVRYETWPTPTAEDLQWQRDRLADLESDPQVDRDYVREFASEIGNIRYRPLQVAGASAADPLPADYTLASALGEEIHAFLKAILAASAAEPPGRRHR